MVPVAGTVIFVENGPKNLGCSSCHFKILRGFPKLAFSMLFDSISKILGLFVGPTGRAWGRMSTPSAVGGSLAYSLVLVRGAPAVDSGHYLQIKLPDYQTFHIQFLEKSRADFSNRLQAFCFIYC